MPGSLKLLCVEMVLNSASTKLSKIELLKFIRYEASDIQLKSLLLNGKISRIDEQSYQIIEDRFIASEFPEILKEGIKATTRRKSLMTQLAPRELFGIPWVIYRIIRSRYDKCTKQCGKFELNTRRRQYCMSKCNISKYKEMMGKATDPKQKSKLKQKLNKAIYRTKQYEEEAKKTGVKL